MTDKTHRPFISQPDDGDASAWYSDLYKMAFPIALKYAKDWELARDLAQEALIKIYQNECKYQNLPKPALKKALNNSIEHLYIDYLRKMDNQALSYFKEDEHFPEHLFIDETSLNEIQALEIESEIQPHIDRLPENQRQALELHCLEGYSKKEIAHIMDKSYKLWTNLTKP